MPGRTPEPALGHFPAVGEPAPLGAGPVAPPQDGAAPERGGRRRLPGWTGNKWVLRAVVWSGLVLLWQVVAMWKGPNYLPDVPAVLGGIVEIFTEGYATTLAKSMEQLVLGFVLTCLLAIPLGALIGRSRIAEDLTSPWVNGLFSAPKEALLPLIIILFGTDFQYRVAVVLLFAFFFPVMNTAAGVRFVDKHMLETARAFGTSRWRTFTQILLPAAAPFVVAGVRLGLGMALKGMIIAELWVTLGTGALLKQFGQQRDLELFFAMALLIVLIGALISQSLLALERRLRRDLITER